MRKKSRNHIITGDLNAHHVMWGSKVSNYRGKKLIDVFDDLDLEVLNTGEVTRISETSGQGNTAIDVSLATEHQGLRKIDWEITTDTFGSDHLPQIITLGASYKNEFTPHPTLKFNTEKADW